MRTRYFLVPLGFFFSSILAQACEGTVPNDTSRADNREFPPAGVIRGAVTYQGQHPCTRLGHVVGGAILFVWNRANPPPPSGLANFPANFAVIAGDQLFANEPRNPGPDTYCPQAQGNNDIVTVTAPYAISPMAAGSYIITAFYDYTGNFYPLLKFRNLPELGDVGGGYVDLNALAAAQALSAANTMLPKPRAANEFVNYVPTYLPIDIGIPTIVPTAAASIVPTFTMPGSGFLRDNIDVTIGLPLPFARPYFYATNPGRCLPSNAQPQCGASDTFSGGVCVPSGAAPTCTTPGDTLFDPADTSAQQFTPAVTHAPATKETDINQVPVITMTQDWQVDAQPGPAEAVLNPGAIATTQSTFVTIQLTAGLPAPEIPQAVALPNYGGPPPYPPFHLQIPSAPQLLAWDSGGAIPETTLVKKMWPLVVLAKLVDDPAVGGSPPGTQAMPPTHHRDPQGIIPSGSDGAVLSQALHQPEPIVILEGLTLFNDSLADTSILGSVPAPVSPAAPGASVSHVSVLVRPSVICFNPEHVDAGGVLVSPHEQGIDPGATTPGTMAPIFDPVAVRAALGAQVRDLRYACLPKGRYEINVVYPTGQAWTVPNEAGSCAVAEGRADFTNLSLFPTNLRCASQPRPLLYSQGTRAVLEIVDAMDPTFCAGQNLELKSRAVPNECLPCNQRVDSVNGPHPGALDNGQEIDSDPTSPTFKQPLFPECF